MSLTKQISDKKVNFEFNKEFINLFSKKIKENDTNFINNTLKELHPSDSADIIENLVSENRSKLIELEGFSLDPEIFIELNESIQTEVFILLSIESIANILKRLESDITRLRDPKNAMNPIASASIIKAMQSEIKELKSINQMPEPSPMGAKKFRSEQFFKNHKGTNFNKKLHDQHSRGFY